MKSNTEISISPCCFEQIRTETVRFITENRIIVDSFWEEHVLAARYYVMSCGEQTAGFFAVHGGSTLVLFHVFDEFLHMAAPLFEHAKKYESVTNAMVPTGDELFLSLCVDSYTRLEKQAYLAVYPEELPQSTQELTLSLADLDADIETVRLCGDFLDDELEKHANGLAHADIYIASFDGETIGFGIIEYGKILTRNASIGMFVLESFRRRGYAAGILRGLKRIAERNGAARVLSGCWYYNHNSKKSMESAGARIKTRLLRFYF